MMSARNSSDLVYKSFKKVDTFVVVCIWAIFLFSFAVLTGQYFLYKYLKPKLLEKELFLYLFSATMVYYLIIILAAFYILLKIFDYKSKESSSMTETEASQFQENDVENTISKGNHEENDLPQINPHNIEQRNQAIPQIYPSLSEACSRSCINTDCSTVDKITSETEINLLNNANFFMCNYHDNKCSKSLENIHLFFEMGIDEYELRRKTIREADLFYHQHMLQTYPKNHMVNVSKDFDSASNEREINVAETCLMVPSKTIENDNHLNGLSHSNQKQFTNKIIPEIIIEDVDKPFSKRSNFQPFQSFDSGKLEQPSTKKSLDTPEEAIKKVENFKYGTYRPAEMTYNIVGLPGLIPNYNEIDCDKNVLNNIHSKKQLKDSNNQNHIKCVLLQRI